MGFASDPRHLQQVVLGSLLGYGALALGFVEDPLAIPASIGAALLAERSIFRFRRGPDRARPSYESAVSVGLSVLLLFRSAEVWAYAAVAALAVSSKLLRFRGRHFVNPTNGALVLGSLCLPGWMATAPWGADLVWIALLALAAVVILPRAKTHDTALAFLAFAFAGQLFRHSVLGYAWPMVVHHLESGPFWLFALYMITDPKTVPQARGARIVHAALVAAGGLALAQLLWVRDSYLWALFLLSPLVPALDHLSLRVARSPQPITGGLPIHDSSTAPATLR